MADDGDVHDNEDIAIEMAQGPSTLPKQRKELPPILNPSLRANYDEINEEEDPLRKVLSS